MDSSDVAPSAASTVRIDGKTKVVPLLAYPSEHVRTPAIFNRYCVENGIAAVMTPWKVAPSSLPKAIEAIRGIENISGAVITIPHKQEMANLCDELQGTAEQVRVCNVVHKSPDGRLVGQMLDGSGFVRGLRDHGMDPAGRSALMAGAGGAATAIAFELLRSGVARLAITNRSREKAEALVELLHRTFPAARLEVNPSDLADYDLALNATSLGMKPGDALPFDPAFLPAEAVVAEVVMQPDTTPLLQRALDRGLQVHKGVHIIEAQVRLLVEFTVHGH